ncbi:hypothetical protein ACP70R_001716 [Stipagrostis hirtigluma subsp. patula]
MRVRPPGAALPDAVEDELERLCATWPGAVPPPRGDPAAALARAALAGLGDGASARVLRRVAAVAAARRASGRRPAAAGSLWEAIVLAVPDESTHPTPDQMELVSGGSGLEIFNQVGMDATGYTGLEPQHMLSSLSRLGQTVGPSDRVAAAIPLNLEAGNPQSPTFDSGNANADTMACDQNETAMKIPSSKRHPSRIPLLMRARISYNGAPIRGSLLDKRLPTWTNCIKPSMIKVKSNPDSSDVQSLDLELISTSNQPRPKTIPTSWFLIALLHYGGVPAEYFMEFVRRASDLTCCVLYEDALRVSMKFADMDNSMSARMLLSGVPIEEPYLQSRLEMMAKEEMKELRQGKITIDDCYYLVGTTDPTGSLRPNEVCVILADGQISGDVLVYNPALPFSDIHVLTARYVRGLEAMVGNSNCPIFFPVSGSQSDGDMFWVSRNSELLKYFSPLESWVQRITIKRNQQKNTSHHESFMGSATSSASVAVAGCWLAYMDRMLTCECSISEKKLLEAKMLNLIGGYYEALDTWKTEDKSCEQVKIPHELMVTRYPHFMECIGYPSYQSKSVLGAIYDEAVAQYEHDLPNPTDPDARKD